jgi:hypothetical protein
MAEPVRHRQTKGAETDMLSLPPPRHISTLRIRARRHASREDRLTGPLQPLIFRRGNGSCATADL